MIQTINNKTYESSPAYFSCEGCTGDDNSTLCKQLGNCKGIIWKEVTMKETIMNKPHIHQKEILAWANGATIQWYNKYCGIWQDTDENRPSWCLDIQYRVKPEPKPDVVVFWFITEKNCPIRTKSGNLSVTFDGETGDIKSAEVIK